jgi:hypothetical protein
MLDMKSMAEKDVLLKLQKKLRTIIAEIEDQKAEGGLEGAGDELAAEGDELGDDMDGMGAGGDFGVEDELGGAPEQLDGGDDLSSARQAYFKPKAPPPRRPGTAVAMMVESMGPKGAPKRSKKGAA